MNPIDIRRAQNDLYYRERKKSLEIILSDNIVT